MTRAKAAERFGGGTKAIRRLLDIGVLHQDAQGNVLLEPNETALMIRDRWLATVPRRRTYADWDLYTEANRLCHVSSKDPHPDFIYEEVAEECALLGSFDRSEIRGFISFHEEMSSFTTQRIRTLAGKFVRSRALAGRVSPCSPDLFRLALPDDLRSLAWTCFDEQRQGDLDPPPAAVLGRLLALRQFFAPASILILRMAADDLSVDAQHELVRGCEQLERLMPDDAGLDLGRFAVQIGPILASHADGSDGRPERGWSRVATVSAYLRLSRRLEEFAMADEANAGTSPIRRYVPERIDDRLKVAERCEVLRQTLLDQGGRKRDGEAERITRHLDRLRAIAKARTTVLTTVGDAARAARDRLLDTEQDFEPFPVEIDTARFEGGAIAGITLLVFYAWRRAAFVDHLVAQHQLWPDTTAALDADTGAPEQVVFELRDVRPVHGDMTTPFWVQMLQTGALATPALMPTTLREGRRAMMLRTGFVRRQSNSGVMSTSLQWSKLYRAGLYRGVTLIPIFQLEHFASIGDLSFQTSAYAFARAGEIQQMVANRTTASGEPAWRREGNRYHFSSIPKKAEPLDGVWPRVERAVSSYIYLRMRKLVRIVCDRDGYEEDQVPAFPPTRMLARKCPPDSYVLGFRGRMLSSGEMAAAEQFLFAGVRGFSSITTHIARYGAANTYVLERKSIEGLQSQLTQKHPDNSKAYVRYARQRLQDDEYAGARDAADYLPEDDE